MRGTSSRGASSLSDARVKERARELGFALAGVTDVRGSAHADFYRAGLGRELHGSMSYLAREDAVARRARPDAAWPELRSAIVLGMLYDGSEASPALDGEGVIARYALSRDYHRVLKARLLELLRWIESELGHELPAARAYVDTGPVLERELAQRAGLGWFGRNTMLINPGLGSYFFLAALLVEVDLESDAPFAFDRCGTCTRCLQACPTGALLGRDATGAPVMDATRCISYLTIENRGAIPEELRPLIGNRIYGCDICQEVCPWNSGGGSRSRMEETAGQGHAQRQRHAAARLHGGARLQDGAGLHGGGAHLHGGAAPGLVPVRAREVSLVEMMRMTPEEWDLYTRGSAMRRAGYAGFRRNVAVALGNWLASSPEAPQEALAALREALEDDDAMVREHAAWALARATR